MKHIPSLIVAAAFVLASCGHEPARAPAPPPPVPPVASASAAPPPVAPKPAGDPFRWLEKRRGERAMTWVHEQNERTVARYAKSPEFSHTRDQILEVYDSEARIPYVNRRGRFLYNFWRDKQHPRGLWRRTTLGEFKKPHPHWDVLLDVDALDKAEGKRWDFEGAACMKPQYKHCLVMLSPNGGDAHVVREFDVPTKSFVKNGFVLPVAKSNVDWIDLRHIYVASDFGPGTMTDSSYPRIVKEWTRGTPLDQAVTVYAGKKTDVAVGASHDRTPGFERDFVSVAKDFYHSDLYQRVGGKLVHVDVPLDSDTDVHRRWLLVQLRSPWTVGGATYPAGALLATPYKKFMAGDRKMFVLFRPDAHTALESYSWTRHHLILDVLDDVKSRLDVLTFRGGQWLNKPLKGAPGLSTVSIADTDPDHSDEYWLSVTGFLTPSSLLRGVIGQGNPTLFKHEPAFFDASRYAVTQHFATSKDGTRVPYFEVAPKDLAANGKNPTLLYGYGGFEVSLLPYYSGSVGRAWLDRGGVYVVANIRGGGEYGPRWHEAALKKNRPLAYQDFAAVARDLFSRKVTSPEHLAAEGASNGGLLMGNMLTKWPELFGAISCEVPLLDMRHYTHLSAGASWIAEYGNPDDPNQWAWIKNFSPYQNLQEGTRYPAVLFYTTTSDDRVGPAQARKMDAKMLAMGDQRVWFYENTEGGHSAGADHKEQAFMHALAFTFMWDHVK
jgi:prolyl oligopeptidase